MFQYIQIQLPHIVFLDSHFIKYIFPIVLDKLFITNKQLYPVGFLLILDFLFEQFLSVVHSSILKYLSL